MTEQRAKALRSLGVAGIEGTARTIGNFMEQIDA